MYRTSLTLACCILYSAAGAASDLSSVYVAPGGIYAPSANVYVRPGQTNRPYAEPSYGYRQPSYEARLPRAGGGLWRLRTRPMPRGLSMSTVRPPIPIVTTLGSRYYAARLPDYEYAPRPPLPVPYRSRARARCDDGYGGWTYCN